MASDLDHVERRLEEVTSELHSLLQERKRLRETSSRPSTTQSQFSFARHTSSVVSKSTPPPVEAAVLADDREPPAVPYNLDDMSRVSRMSRVSSVAAPTKQQSVMSQVLSRTQQDWTDGASRSSRTVRADS